jgi:hypothetical protein
MNAIEVAKVNIYSPGTVRIVRLNLYVYGNTKAPPNGGGQKQSTIPPMLDELRENHGSYQYKMVNFL